MMPTFYLKDRAATLTEQMDALDCDPEKLTHTYAQFFIINMLVSNWVPLYRRHIRYMLKEGAKTVLDVGCGGGDIVRLLAQLAKQDGLEATFVGIDPDPRAIAFANAQDNGKNIRFEQTRLEDFTVPHDVVLSNHVLHHLKDDEIAPFCLACERVTKQYAIHDDICRDDLAFALFPLVAGWFRDSYILEDGRRSIRRAFTLHELEAMVPTGWRVQRVAPFRLLLMRSVKSNK
jgi:2-polyprenyl-3-methyl-5-hydroxy-6-metoxy-1,4-benzoquinol methylase